VADRDRDELGRPRNARPRDRTGRPLSRGAPDAMADRQEPDEVVRDIGDALRRAVDLVDGGRLFEAHEFLEWVWKSPDVAAADRDFWKGVTQVVVAGVHQQRGNASGVARLASRGAALLRGYPPGHRGVDTVALLADAERLLAAADGPDPAEALRRVAPPRLRLLA